MVLTFGVVVDAILVVLGLLWCREVFRRFPSDLEELRSSRDGAARGAILFWWVVTAVIVAALVNFLLGILARIL